jgi:hypothetical protein
MATAELETATINDTEVGLSIVSSGRLYSGDRLMSQSNGSSGGWPILNFAPFAKFRVGILRRRSSRNRRHENMKERQEDSVQQ